MHFYSQTAIEKGPQHCFELHYMFVMRKHTVLWEEKKNKLSISKEKLWLNDTGNVPLDVSALQLSAVLVAAWMD